MIARLRRRHRVATIALAALFPPAFALALASRGETAPVSSIPAALRDMQPNGAPLWSRDDLWPALPARTQLFAASREAGPLVEVAPRRDPQLPDLLVYWAPDGGADRLPDGAVLLGRLAGGAPRTLALPAAARTRAGRLYLYSLGHAQLVDSAALPSGAE